MSAMEDPRAAVAGVLLKATSSLPAELEEARLQLDAWETQPGFWSVLLSLCFDRQQLPTAVRTAGMIRFKNSVERYWRARVVGRVKVSIAEEEKSALRKRLLEECLDEPEQVVALQATVAMARIARYDFPSAWPDLFATLQQSIVDAHAAGTTLRLLRAVDAVRRLLKELDSVRMMAGKMRMTTLADQLLPTLVPMFEQYFAETFSGQSPQPEKVRVSHLFLKAIRPLVVSDAGTLSASARDARGDGSGVHLSQSFFRSTPRYLETLAGGERSDIHNHLLGFGKLFLALVDRPNGKAHTWDGWPDVVGWYWQQAGGADDKFTIQALLLLKRSLELWKQQAPAAFSSPAFVESATDLLVGRLMKLQPDELVEWEADPEAWSVSESQKQQEFQLDVRTAAERTLMVLAVHVRPRYTVGRRVWAMLEASGGDDVLAREAIYAAVGRLWDQLPVLAPGREPEPDDEPGELIDVSAVLAGRLSHEASTGGVVLQRRIAWLAAQWSEHVHARDRPAVYALLVHLVAQTDAAVRLAAAQSLGALSDSLEFDPDAFQPYLESALSHLAAALGEFSEMDSIRICTDALSLLIERMGARVAPHLGPLAALVPRLWAQPDPDHKARPSLLVLVGSLLRSVELLAPADLSPAHALVRDLVRDALQPDTAPFLGPDALQLWARAIHSAATLTRPLFELVPLAMPLLASAEETPEACRLLEEYALLDVATLVSTHGTAIFAGFAAILADPASPVVLPPLATIELVVQALQVAQLDGQVWFPVVADVFRLVVASLLELDDSAAIRNAFVGALTRIVVALPDALLGPAFALFAPLQTLWPPLLARWANAFETMHSPRKRTALALAAAKLMRAAANDESLASAVCEKLPELIDVWSTCLADRREAAQGPAAQERFMRSLAATEDLGAGALDTDTDDWLEDTAPGAARLAKLAEHDPIVAIDLQAEIVAVLATIARTHSLLWKHVVAALDPTLAQLLQDDLALTSLLFA